MIKLEIRGISKAYTINKPVIEPIDLVVNPGELFFLLGPSGCGKSTLLRIIAGFIKPDTGKIFFDDKDITSYLPEKRNTAMVFQNYALWPHLTVFENVAFGLNVKKIYSDERNKAVMSALKLVCMDEYAQRRPASLSGGQQQRVALARALAIKPGILLLDEPLSNLDAKLRDTMRQEIHQICKSANLTTIYVTHDRKEALSMADRIAVIHQGKLQQIGTPSEIYRHPINNFVASFLGQTNIIECRVIAVNNSFCKLSTPFGELQANLPAFEISNGQTITGMFRPECLRIVETSSNAPNIISGEISSMTFLGENNIWEIATSNGVIICCENCAPQRLTGTKIILSINPEHIVLFPEQTI
jgi:iron(III) transport system ATP-binding protein